MIKTIGQVKLSIKILNANLVDGSSTSFIVHPKNANTVSKYMPNI